MAVILVDFDGTCIPSLPEAGYVDVDTGAERVLKRLIVCGHKIVLWTCRNNSMNNPFNYIYKKYRFETSLEEAERWFEEREIPLYGVNNVPGEEEIVGYSRKALGDILIDDTSLGIPLIWGEVEYCSYDTGELKKAVVHCVDWNRVEKMLEDRDII